LKTWPCGQCLQGLVWLLQSPSLQVDSPIKDYEQ
jgi:hypothetical protein